MFIITVIIIVVIVLIVKNSGDKNKNQKSPSQSDTTYTNLLNISPATTRDSSIPDVYIKGNILSKTQRILNLVSSENLIHVFSFSNGVVSIKTQTGCLLQGPLNEISVEFKYSGSTGQRQANINYKGRRIEIIEEHAAISQADNDKIFAVLSHAGNVNGLYYITPEGMAQARQLAQMKTMQQIRQTQLNQQMWNNILRK